MMKKKATGIDLFSGVGGMSLGFEQAGFDVLAAIDNNIKNKETHSINFPNTKFICKDIEEITGQAILKIINKRSLDVVFGGAPCQGFSVAGNMDVKDKRNKLILEFARIVVELKPKYFVLENVKGILNERYKNLLSKFTSILKKAGYSITEPYVALNACHFGVPQDRQRVFIMGCLSDLLLPDYPSTNLEIPKVTVWDAIGDLAFIRKKHINSENGTFTGNLEKPSEYAAELRQTFKKSITGFYETEHSRDVIRRFKETKPGSRDFVSRFHKLEKQGLCPTLRAGTGPEKGNFMAARPIHPTLPRCIYVREAARLHSYPDWFAFHQTKWHAFMQIGNSVPPKLAKVIASQIIKLL